MTQERQEEILDQLSKTAACTFVLARAFNLWNKKLEHMARKVRSEYKQETKLALRNIEEGCKKTSKGLEHFEDWAIASGITESGHTGDDIALCSYLTDGAWVAQLAGYSFNAAAENDAAREVIKAYCKSQVKGKPKISYEMLEEFNPEV